MAALTLHDLRGNPARLRKERAIKILLLATAAVSVVVSALIVYSLVFRAYDFITSVEFSALWGDDWAPRNDKFSLKSLISASAMVTGVAMLVAVPLGLGAAIYLSEYANPRVRRVLKPALEVLAGIPSVVVGFFCITFISPTVVQRFFGSAGTFSLLSAGIGVGILSIPLVASVSEDAMRSVPTALREASYGLGARKVTTSIKVVVPAAVSGLVAALILAAARALGETMVVLLAAGSANASQFTANPLDEGLTMTAAIASQIRGTDRAVGGDLVLPSLFFVGFLLFAATLVLNVIAERFVQRVRQRY